MTTPQPLPRAERAVMAVEGFVAFWAFAGAYGLVSGTIPLGDSVDELPLESPVLGGVALALIVGVVPVTAIVLALRRAPQARAAHIAAGCAVMGWIAVQVAFIGLVSWLQPAIFVIGALIAALAASRWRVGS
jgi:hypothetical protein